MLDGLHFVKRSFFGEGVIATLICEYKIRFRIKGGICLSSRVGVVEYFSRFMTSLVPISSSLALTLVPGNISILLNGS